MAVVFVLGPGEWDPDRGPPLRFTPRSVRERVAESLRQHGHDALLIILRTWLGRKPLPRLWVFHHESVATIRRGESKVLERGARSRYLDAVARLGVSPIPWRDHEDLHRLVALFMPEL